MTNREWLNKLSDEEFVQQYALIGCTHSNCHTVDDDCKRCRVMWLEEEHETTADEDFIEHDYFKTEQNEFVVIYKGGKIRDDNTEVYVYPTETKILVLPKNETRYIHLENNDIRTIADKKRKEMNWIEEVQE